MKFYGRVEHSKLPFLINSYDVIVLPSLINSSESFPNSLLEAMSCGKPIIASNIYGIPEMVTHNVNGILVPQKNSRALKNAIETFIKNPYLINKMGKEGRKRVLKKFVKEEQIQKLYDSLS